MAQVRERLMTDPDLAAVITEARQETTLEVAMDVEGAG